MNVLRKHLKALALSLLVVFFVSASHTNASALGSYRTTTPPSTNTQMQVEAAFPALAYGAIVVGAFVIGAVNGYYERQSSAGDNQLEMAYATPQDHSDFSSFDI